MGVIELYRIKNIRIGKLAIRLVGCNWVWVVFGYCRYRLTLALLQKLFLTSHHNNVYYYVHYYVHICLSAIDLCLQNAIGIAIEMAR